MKKAIVLSLLFILPLTYYAQKIEENKIDPVTHLLEQRTTWERFTQGGEFNSYFRVCQYDSAFFLQLRIINADKKPFDIKAGQPLVLTMSDGGTVTLTCFKTTTSCQGCGAVTIAGSQVPGVEAEYALNKEQLEKLRFNVLLTKEQYEKHKKKTIEHIKIDTSTNPIEHDLSEFSYLQIRKAIRLIKK